ncbi:hypothetical protein QBC36DRAFT_340737 [Triangularia setosa]|uniref:F-box domain-containing protein n=1 Tax=Triangularia setosa TaxID=2587417 RepID=A0AAN6VZM2_9PEZI|nr:hypothetical protein QBC36DRAFT_340737 [Podospora setosa]
MASPTLATLPTEILLRICRLLSDSHFPSLEALAQANRHCFSVAAAVLTDTITFYISKPARLAKDVEHCKRILQQRNHNLFQHVHRLIIVGCMERPHYAIGSDGQNPLQRDDSDSEADDDAGGADSEPLRPARKRSWHLSLPSTTDFDTTRANLHGFLSGSAHRRGAIPLTPRGNHRPAGPWPDSAPASAAYESDHQWQPLADLISQLPGLADVVYRCPSQFPPCLLMAMHTKQKKARLHLQMFRLRSAFDNSPTIDPHERAIITSPCLYGVWIQYSNISHIPNELRPFSNHLCALEWIFEQALVSAALKEVHIVYNSKAEWSPYYTDDDPYSHQRAPVSSLSPASFFGQRTPGSHDPPHSQKGRLTHLKLSQGDILWSVGDPRWIFTIGQLQNWVGPWNVLTDFALLQSLTLDQLLSEEQLVTLTTTSFPALNSLYLACELPRYTRGVGTRLEADYYQRITRFLNSLPSLKALEITGWDHSALIFSFNCPGLQRLSLIPMSKLESGALKCDYGIQTHVTPEGLTALTTSFPQLTDLAVSVLRSRGDAAEIARYNFIGDNLPRLRRLSLMLDCSPPRLTPINGQHNEGGIPLVKPYLSPSVSRIPSSVAPILDKDRNEPADPACSVNRYRNGHVYDIFINSALNASLAQDIFAAVGGNVDTLLLRPHGGANLSQKGPPPGNDFLWRISQPAGHCLKPFLNIISKEWMLERMNDHVVVTELGKERFRSETMDPLRVDNYKLMEYFRRVWPEKPGSKGWWDDWESWGLQV